MRRGVQQALRVGSQIDTPEKKRDFNERHFGEAATRYDLATRAMSLGRDQAWKHELVAALPPLTAPVCVDLASGTGDVAFLLGERYPEGGVTGIDLTAEMVAIARQRNRYSNVSFACQDMTALGFADRSVDLVTGSYALRNAPGLSRALLEVNRILKPGGAAAFLDFSKPAGKLRQDLQFFLLKCWCGLWGTLLHGTPAIHGYIADSLRQFPARGEYHRQVAACGFAIVSSRLFYFGMLEILVVRKK